MNLWNENIYLFVTKQLRMDGYLRYIWRLHTDYFHAQAHLFFSCYLLRQYLTLMQYFQWFTSLINLLSSSDHNMDLWSIRRETWSFVENLETGKGQDEVQHWVQPPVPTELITVDVFSTGSVQQEPELSPLRPRALSKTLRLTENAVFCTDHTPQNNFHYPPRSTRLWRKAAPVIWALTK